MTINELAYIAHYSIFLRTPYDTGNLAREGIGDVGSAGLGTGETGFDLFNNGYTQYGALLNEQPIINYKIRNNKTGKVYAGSYANKHYKWVDKFADDFANLIPSLMGVRRIQ